MSQENVEIVQRVYKALTDTGEPAWELLAADFEFDASGVLPDTPPSRGHDEAGRIFRSYSEMFEDFRVVLEEVIASDNEHVVTAVEDGGRMTGSDAEVRNRFFHVFTIREGEVVRWSSHLDRAGALAAAELSE